MTSITMYYKNNRQASLFVWAMGKEGAIVVTPSTFSDSFIMVRNSKGDEIRGRWGQKIKIHTEGIWELELSPTGSDTSLILDISVDGELYPFIIPGPGIIPSHFPTPEPTLLFPACKDTEVWVDVPEDIPLVNIGAWLGQLDPSRNNGDVELPNGEIKIIGWKCLPLEHNFHHVSDMDARGFSGWWKIRLPEVGNPLRLTVWEGLPLFLRKPQRRVPYGKLVCTAAEYNGMEMDARFTVFYFGQKIAQRDALKGETTVIPVVAGQFLVQATRGTEFDSMEKAVEVNAGQDSKLSFRLNRVLEPQKGWVCGDHHMHSFYFDGAQSPEMLARAARANGLSYIFLTDEDPQVLLDAGLQDHNEDGCFTALPGTEIMFRGVHMNALNVRKFVKRGADHIESIESWIHEVKTSGTDEHPVAVMLNHPAHISRSQPLQPYFRSWWVADILNGIDLVENFDFTTWFDRLNYGSKLPGLWTTDGHDIAFVPPGKKGTYVYVGKQLTEASIIEGLVKGRSFNTRYPGAMLYVTANGAMIGDTAVYDVNGKLTVNVSCQSTRPLEYVELVADGKVLKKWDGNRNFRFEAEVQISHKVKWLIVKAYAFVEEGCWPVDDTSMEPLLETGCIAFTNPIWVESK